MKRLKEGDIFEICLDKKEKVFFQYLLPPAHSILKSK